jgi:hypothetical protein
MDTSDALEITLRHYRPWVKSLQDHLEREVQKAWAAHALEG